MPQATVIVPTFDNGPTLLYSIRSALAQTVEDIEVFVVGDGVPDATRGIVSELALDERVRFFDNPKGPRHGEVHRNSALEKARSETVCYLSDDDLWLPNHIETVLRLLSGADFANTLPVYFDRQGEPRFHVVDLALPTNRELMLSGINRVPLSCGAHTLEAYRRLPHGWRTTPWGTPTDLYMWQQFLAEEGCRAVSGARSTVLNFPKRLRRDWIPEDRLAELELWSRRIAEPGRGQFAFETFEGLARSCAAELAPLRVKLQTLERQASKLEKSLKQERRTSETLGQQIRDIRSSRTWKLLDRLNRLKTALAGKLRDPASRPPRNP